MVIAFCTLVSRMSPSKSSKEGMAPYENSKKSISQSNSVGIVVFLRFHVISYNISTTPWGVVRRLALWCELFASGVICGLSFLLVLRLLRGFFFGYFCFPPEKPTASKFQFNQDRGPAKYYNLLQQRLLSDLFLHLPVML